MRYIITTPEPRWTGEVAGVAFAHGRGLVDDPPARVINYFKRKGYGVEQLDAGDGEDAVLSEGASSPGGGPDNLQHAPGTSVGSEPAKGQHAGETDGKAASGDTSTEAEPKKTATRRASTTSKGDEK